MILICYFYLFLILELIAECDMARIFVLVINLQLDSGFTCATQKGTGSLAILLYYISFPFNFIVKLLLFKKK